MLIQATFQDLGKAKSPALETEAKSLRTPPQLWELVAIPHYHLDLHVHLGASSHPLQLASLKC